MTHDLAAETLDELSQFAGELAEESGQLIMEYFRSEMPVSIKADASPVTEADRQAEALMCRRIQARFPQHQILGEESGQSGPGNADWQWVLDPIDGTYAFIHQIPLFGSLIGLLYGGQPVLGVIHLPATKELMIGVKNRGTRLNDRPVQVSRTNSLQGASVLFTDPGHMENAAQCFAALHAQGAILRGWGDCCGPLMVACGRSDAMIESGLKLWDVVALRPCIEEAGGQFTDFQGQPTLGPDIVCSNGRIHGDLLKTLEA